MDKYFYNSNFKNKIINKDKYNNLCYNLDRILLDEKSTFTTHAISWLHVIKEHPIFLKKYVVLFINNYLFLLIFKFLYNFIINIINVFYNLLKIKVNKIPDISKDIDYLFISHLVDFNIFNSKNDFYYGKIPFELNSKNKKVAFIFFNLIKKKKKFFKKY